MSNLLSIDELLETVVTEAHTGRCSVTTASNMPLNEMTSHCEALMMGKQQKMSTLMSFQQNNQKAGLPINQPDQMEAALFCDEQPPQLVCRIQIRSSMTTYMVIPNTQPAAICR